MKTMRHVLLSWLLAAGMLSAASELLAENWPNWRGPHYNGSSSERGLPAEFSKTNKVKWAVDLTGAAAATPIIWGDNVFISSVDERAGKLLALCFDCATGRELWRREAGEGIKQDGRSNYASSSPVTDGKTVYFFYGNGELLAFDLSGNQVWSRNIQKDYGSFAFLWTFSSSPTLSEGKLFLQVLQRDVPVNGRGRKNGPNDSYLLALDPASGQELWKQIRPSEAVGESREAFTTPIPFEHRNRREILVAGGDCLTGHDPKTGKELWRWGTWNPSRIGHWRLVPSPMSGGDVVLACGPKGAPIYAVKAGADGTLDHTGLAWISKAREVSSDVATPLFYRGHFYVLNGNRKTIACVEPGAGDVVWTGELESKAIFESSPTAADGKIFFMNFKGDVFVLQAGDAFKVLQVAPMGDSGDDMLRSSIAIAGGNLFVRTGRKLYCIGEQ